MESSDFGREDPKGSDEPSSAGSPFVSGATVELLSTELISEAAVLEERASHTKARADKSLRDTATFVPGAGIFEIPLWAFRRIRAANYGRQAEQKRTLGRQCIDLTN